MAIMKRAATIIIVFILALLMAAYLWVRPELAQIDRRIDVASKRDYPIHLEQAVMAADFPMVLEKPPMLRGFALALRLTKLSTPIQARSLERRAKSTATAIALGVKHDLRAILRAYLETVYLGRSGPRLIIGVEDGSTIIFGKPAGRLELHESALLAGMMRSSVVYDPHSQPDRSWQRRNAVLSKMLELRMITRDEHEKAVRAPLR